jgi:hypothetical protein
MYKCTTCQIEKDIAAFSYAPTKLGHKKQCKSCISEYMKKYYKKNPEQYKKHKKLVKENDKTYKGYGSHRRHGLSDEQHKVLINKYNGLCHSCMKNAATCVDHDHGCCPGPFSCGDCVRGVLCNWCNSALAHTQDNRQTILKLVEYLDSTTRQ